MSIGTVGIIGAGTMGSGIAINLAQSGLEVRLTDARPETAAGAVEMARTFFARACEKSRMSAADAEQALGRIRVVGGLPDMAGCDLVIEAVFEDLDLKCRMFEELNQHVAPTALVATNTSCLKVSDLARAIEAPERFLGLHYFSPAQVNPIVEVVKGEATSDTVIEYALELCRTTGKIPITCRDQFGFAINRFFCPYTNEAARALDEGLGSTAEIDAVAREAVGAAAGPFLVMNIIKPRINLHAIRHLTPLGPFYAPAASMAETGDADRSWDIGKSGGMAPEQRAAIADRLRLGCFLPVLQELDEGVAAPDDIDLGAREALKFGRPPCALMDELGRAEVERIVAPALDRWGIVRPRSLERVGSLTG